ncbi:MAG: hypothetical protein WCI65_12535 [Synechococcaceae cyanobacterium ELA263]
MASAKRLLERIATSAGALPEVMTLDAGYWSEDNARKDDASPFRPFQPPGSLMEPIDASLQRGRQG